MSLPFEQALVVRTFAPGERVSGLYQDGVRSVWTLTVTEATDEEDYGVDLASPAAVDVTVTAGVDTTVAAIADAIAEAWNASDGAEYATAESDGVDTVTFTGVDAGPLVLELDENAATMTLEEATEGVDAYVESDIRGVWRPMPEKRLDRLPEGERRRDPRVLYTTTALTIASQHEGVLSAWVSPDSGATWYELEADFDGTTLPGPVSHYRYKALRLQESDG